MATWRADQLHPLRFLQPRAAPNSDLANNFVVMWLGALKARGVVAPDIALQAVGGADSNLHSVIYSLDDLKNKDDGKSRLNDSKRNLCGVESNFTYCTVPTEYLHSTVPTVQYSM